MFLYNFNGRLNLSIRKIYTRSIFQLDFKINNSQIVNRKFTISDHRSVFFFHEYNVNTTDFNHLRIETEGIDKTSKTE